MDTNTNNNSGINWNKVEENVNKGEKLLKQAMLNKRAQALGILEKPVPKAPERRNTSAAYQERMKKFTALAAKSTNEDVAQALLATDQYEKEAHTLLGKEEHALASLRYKNLAEALRLEKEVEKLLDANKESEMLVQHGLEREPNNPVLMDYLQKNTHEREDLTQEMKDLYMMSPEAFIGLHLKDMKEYRGALEKRKMVETPSVRKVKDDIKAHLAINKPTFVSGHLGSGKTELAINISEELTGEPALIISGSEDTSLAELYGHQVLRIQDIQIDKISEYNQEVELKFENWKEENKAKLEKMKPTEKEAEVNRAHDRFLQLYITQFQSGSFSHFILGPVYKAMEEGRMLILDEVNAIPHEILISLNHILTRKPGDIISVPLYGKKEITIKKGFGVIATGNLNTAKVGKVYIGRKELDLAWVNRFYEKDYDYLPQSTNRSVIEASEADEQFHLLLAYMMDNKGNLALPEGGERKLWELARCAKILQNLFSGKEDGKVDLGGSSVNYTLQKAVPSFRDLLGILEIWKKKGFEKELDYYIFNEYINRNSFSSSDKAYIYQRFSVIGGFFKSPGWSKVLSEAPKNVEGTPPPTTPTNPGNTKNQTPPVTPSAPSEPKKVEKGVFDFQEQAKHFYVIAPENKEKKIKIHTPREVVELAYGKAPERTEFPNMEAVAEETKDDIEALQELQEHLAFFEEILEQADSVAGKLEKKEEQKGTENVSLPSNN